MSKRTRNSVSPLLDTGLKPLPRSCASRPSHESGYMKRKVASTLSLTRLCDFKCRDAASAATKWSTAWGSPGKCPGPDLQRATGPPARCHTPATGNCLVLLNWRRAARGGMTGGTHGRPTRLRMMAVMSMFHVPSAMATASSGMTGQTCTTAAAGSPACASSMKRLASTWWEK